jgi:hypothetical protein
MDKQLELRWRSSGVQVGIATAIVLGTILTASPLQAATLTEWKFDPKTNHLEVTVKDGTTPRYFLVAQPARIVLDLPGTSIDTAKTQAVYSGAVRQIRVSQFQPGLTRIVLDLAPDVKLAAGQVKLQKTDNSRWVLQPLIASSPVATSGQMPAALPALPSPKGTIAPLPASKPIASIAAPPLIAAPTQPALIKPALIKPVAIQPVAIQPAPIAAPRNSAITATTPQPAIAPIETPMPPTPESAAAPIQSETSLPVAPNASSQTAASAIVSQSGKTPSPTEIPATFAIVPVPAPATITVPPLQRSSETSQPTIQPAIVMPSSQPRSAQLSPIKAAPQTASAPQNLLNTASNLEIPTTLPGLSATVPPTSVSPPPATPAAPTVTVPPLQPQPSSTPTVTVPPLQPAPATVAPQFVVPTAPPANPTQPSVIEFGQPLRSPQTEPRSSTGNLIPAGTILDLRYPGTQALRLQPGTPFQEVLLLQADIRNLDGNVIVPAGTKVIGRFETTQSGSRFVAQAIALPGRTVAIAAQSEPLAGSRKISQQNLAINSGIGALAGGVASGSGIGAIGGAATAAAVTVFTAPKPATIQPGQVVPVKLLQDFR